MAQMELFPELQIHSLLWDTVCLQARMNDRISALNKSKLQTNHIDFIKT